MGVPTLIRKLDAGASSFLTNKDISIYPSEYECLPIQFIKKNNTIARKK